jgi:hypothetical protein
VRANTSRIGKPANETDDQTEHRTGCTDDYPLIHCSVGAIDVNVQMSKDRRHVQSVGRQGVRPLVQDSDDQVSRNEYNERSQRPVSPIRRLACF